MRQVIAAARTGTLRSSQMVDPTITVTNLGDQGADAVSGSSTRHRSRSSDSAGSAHDRGRPATESTSARASPPHSPPITGSATGIAAAATWLPSTAACRSLTNYDDDRRSAPHRPRRARHHRSPKPTLTPSIPPATSATNWTSTPSTSSTCGSSCPSVRASRSPKATTPRSPRSMVASRTSTRGVRLVRVGRTTCPRAGGSPPACAARAGTVAAAIGKHAVHARDLVSTQAPAVAPYRVQQRMAVAVGRPQLQHVARG